MTFEIIPLAPGHYRMSGDLDSKAALDWKSFCRVANPAAAGSICFDMMDVDVVSGAACAIGVDAIRVLIDRGFHPILDKAPQELAHVLYRVGMLPCLTLRDPREEMPTSS